MKPRDAQMVASFRKSFAKKMIHGMREVSVIYLQERSNANDSGGADGRKMI